MTREEQLKEEIKSEIKAGRAVIIVDCKNQLRNVMQKTILKIKQYNMAIIKDEDNKILLSYNLKDNEVQRHTEGILKEVNQEIADIIHNYFDINLDDYNIKVQDASIKIT